MRAAEPELGQNLIRIADKIAIGEEQKFDEVEIRLVRRRCVFERRGGGARFGHYADIRH